jgi:hypothetical protein
MKKTCIVLFSHADSPEKEKILGNTLDSLRIIDLPIILVSHVPVSAEKQEKCDYVIYEKNNLLLKETDFFEEELPLTEANFNSQFFFGGISTRCYVLKKTYGPAVINLYINGFRQAEILGYDYGLFWEYDYLLDKSTCDNLKKIISEISMNEMDGFFVPCKISGIDSITAVPAIFPIKKFIKFLPTKIIENAKEYIEASKMMICEEWINSFVGTLENPKLLGFENYYSLFTESNNNLVFSGTNNPSFSGLNSGLFMEKEDKKNWMLSVYNYSEMTVEVTIETFLDGNPYIKLENTFPPGGWSYTGIPREVSESVLENNSHFKVLETISAGDFTERYEYDVNFKNIDSISKGKIFFYYNQ